VEQQRQAIMAAMAARGVMCQWLVFHNPYKGWIVWWGCRCHDYLHQPTLQLKRPIWAPATVGQFPTSRL